MTRHEPSDAFEQFAPEVDMEIDLGVRRWVLILRANGVETFESCQGGEGHAMPEPTIKFFGSSWAGYRAFAIAMEHGMPVLDLRHVYSVVDGQLQGPWWEMTFRTTDPDP
jgi:hypothetical protein